MDARSPSGPAGPAGDGVFVPPPRRQVALSMACVTLAIFLAALSQMVVATTLPFMVADLGGFDRYTWAVTSYMVATTVAFPIAGRLSDLYGRRQFLILGLAVFVVGSVLTGSCRSMTQLIVFRAVQGIGGGVIMTSSYAAIADLFPPLKRGKAHGLLGAVYGVASIAGPILGGYGAQHLSWSWCFMVIGLAGILVLGLTWRIFPRSGAGAVDRKPDYPGMVVLVCAAVPLLLALSSAGAQYAWASPQILGLLGFGLAMAALFAIIETRSESPIMPLEIHANRKMAVAFMVTLLTSLGLYGSVLFLPLFFQVVMDVSAADSGSRLVPMVLGMIAGAIVSGQLFSRTGGRYRALAPANTACMAAGMVLLSTLDPDTSALRSGIYIVLAGFGFGGAVATLSVTVQNAVPHGLVGAATSALQFYRSVGGMVGLAVLGAMMARSFAARLDATVPDSVRAALPEGRFDALRTDPRALVDPSAAAAMEAELARTGADGAAAARTLLDSLETALVGAMDDVFTAAAAATALSVVAALFFRAPTFAGRGPARHDEAEDGRFEDDPSVTRGQPS